MPENFSDIAARAIDHATKLGVDMAEAYVVNAKALAIEVHNGGVETMKLAEDRGIGLRLINGGKVGFAFSTELTTGGVQELAKQAFANIAGTETDQYNILPERTDQYPQLDLYDAAIATTTIEEKIQLAVNMEKAARKYDPRVKIIESATYQDGETAVFIVNSQGLAANYQGTYFGLYLALVANEHDDNQTGFALDYNLKYKHLDAIKIGNLAAERAVRMLGAKPVATAKVAVVLDPYIVTGFLGLLGSALTAEAVQKGRSLFAGKTGQNVASKQITIIDDGTKPDGIASAPFDGEGVATSKTVLIQAGVLQGYLHNIYTAAKDGVTSTGNGIRSSFKSNPEVGTTNFYIEPGKIAPADLIKDITAGLYLTEVMGMHTANPISGDFSLGAAGIWIENGKLTKPVRGVAIAGNVMDLLKSVDAIGSDLQFYGGKGAPTLRVSQMTVSG
ncbi:MAG: TldD/PmbA family protein [Desulfotomaculum sp.]|nr:TldD/PmbA family protein [Desulfotomaculum sp.]